MQTRQESAPARKYTSPGTNRVAPKFRSGLDWSTLPDYQKLPDFALIDKSEVALLTGMSHSVIERRVKEQKFAAPNRHGSNAVWSLGYVRRWCEQFGQTLDEGGAA